MTKERERMTKERERRTKERERRTKERERKTKERERLIDWYLMLYSHYLSHLTAEREREREKGFWLKCFEHEYIHLLPFIL